MPAVAIDPSEQAPPAARIVVGVDGSEPSRRALRWAAFLAGILGADIEAVMVWEPMPGAGFGRNFAGAPDLHREMQKSLGDAVDAVFGSERPATLTLHTYEAYPAAKLIARSRDATLLVIGNRGHGGFADMIFGSVSATCVKHAACPVFVVHNAEPPAPASSPKVASAEGPYGHRS
jgi:nucleotide-binding universal stress UspA family protein